MSLVCRFPGPALRSGNVPTQFCQAPLRTAVRPAGSLLGAACAPQGSGPRWARLAAAGVAGRAARGARGGLRGAVASAADERGVPNFLFAAGHEAPPRDGACPAALFHVEHYAAALGLRPESMSTPNPTCRRIRRRRPAFHTRPPAVAGVLVYRTELRVLDAGTVAGGDVGAGSTPPPTRGGSRAARRDPACHRGRAAPDGRGPWLRSSSSTGSPATTRSCPLPPRDDGAGIVACGCGWRRRSLYPQGQLPCGPPGRSSSTPAATRRPLRRGVVSRDGGRRRIAARAGQPRRR